MINLNYSLNKEDYLTFQLYIASINPRIKNQRLRSRVIYSVLFVLLGAIFFDNNIYTSYFFFFFALLSIFLHPLYSKWLYKRHYTRQVNQTFDPDNNSIAIQLNDSTIESQDKKTSSSVKFEGLSSIIETNDHFYLQLDKVMYLILPKNRIPYDEVKTFLQNRSKELGISYKEELDWKWK